MKFFRHTLLVTFLFIFSLILLTGCNQKATTQIVNATVVYKEYIENPTLIEINADGERKIIVYPKQYNVMLKYEDILTTFDSQELYDSLDVGDTIEVNLTIYYDDDGNVIYREISRKQ